MVDSGQGREWFIRCLFKGNNKVWARCDPEGRLAVEGDRVAIRYRLEDGRRYSAAEGSLTPVAGCRPVSGAVAGEEPEPEDRPRAAVKRRSAVRPAGVEPVVVYTDGACSGNPGPAGAGILLSYRGKERRVSQYLGRGTSNIAELEAIRIGLGLLQRKDLPVDLYTDSKYALGLLTLGWKAKANGELVEEVRQLVASFSDLRIIKVAGHAGIGPNEEVDRLAREAVARGC